MSSRSTFEVPAASIQERMWLAEKLEPGNGLYNVPLAWRVRGRLLSPDTLASALAGVVERHEILRTAFVERDGRLYQSIGEPWAPEIERADFRDRPGTDLTAWLAEFGRRSFDLGTNRLLRAGLAECAGEEQVFTVCLHHLVSDAGSVPVFMADLRDCYEAVAA